MIRCTTCGADATDDAAKCPRCGSVLTTMVATAAAAASGASRSTSTLSRITSTSTPDEGRFVPGTLITGRYRIIGLVGRGGMGEVYRATDLTLAQSVALKFLPEDTSGSIRLLERFHNEVRIARQVSHPNVCRVYDIGEYEGVPFMSMEYVDGEDLASLLLRIGRLPSGKAAEIARKICAGLAAAHEKGVIHRDLKPHNVMLNRRGEVVVMDFGLAAVADELRGGEARNGTPAYMSPEQLRGESVTARSDIYALGLIIYELFTGKKAFEASSVPDLMRMQEAGRPPSVASVAADADPAVEKVILRCLHPDSAQRPGSALAVAAALPGGDPLAAALAAGETPSPELVAASGKTEGLAFKYALPLLAFVLLVLLAFPFATQQTAMLAQSPIELAPAVLEAKARELASAFGYPGKPLDWGSEFDLDRGMIQHLEKTPGVKSWAAWLTAEQPYRLVYRESPRYLLSPPNGAITADRPALTYPGMVSLSLDSRGRLRSFAAVAPREENPSAPAVAFDPATVFRAAGFDIAQFRETAPSFVPPRAFDSRSAWIGKHPGLPGTEITVELATWRGKLTNFYIKWPWSQPVGGVEKTRTLADWASTLFSMLFVSTGLFCIAFFARRNLQLGRGDKQGARRIAAAAFVLYALTWAGRAHVMPQFDLIGYAVVELSLGFALAAVIWLLYVALEPAVRSRWPHSLITWNRVLAGNFGDARVASHILAGVGIGVSMLCLLAWRQYWVVRRGGAPDAPDLAVLGDLRAVFAAASSTVLMAIMSGGIIFFLLCGVRAIVRRDWLAAVVAALLLVLQDNMLRNSQNLAIDVPLFIAIFVAIAFMLLRMGMVTAMTALITINTLGRVPVGADAGAWYVPIAVLQISMVAALALYAFWRSQTPAVKQPST